MKCLTICQPYATLICTAQAELPPGYFENRVENRTWHCSYRGSLLIHAGKSLKWLDDGDTDLFPDMPFGAIVGRCQMIDCVATINDLMSRVSPKSRFAEDVQKRHPWLMNHSHAEGPFCFVLDKIERFTAPIPYSGKQGLFEVDESILEGVTCR